MLVFEIVVHRNVATGYNHWNGVSWHRQLIHRFQANTGNSFVYIIT